MKAFKRFASGATAHKCSYTVHILELHTIHDSLKDANLAIFWRRRAESGTTPSHQVQPSPDGSYRYVFFGHQAEFPVTLYQREDGFEEKLLDLKLKQVQRTGTTTVFKTTFDLAKCRPGSPEPFDVVVPFQNKKVLWGQLKLRIVSELSLSGNASDMSASEMSVPDSDTSATDLEEEEEEECAEPVRPQFGKQRVNSSLILKRELQQRHAGVRGSSGEGSGLCLETDVSKMDAPQLRERIARDKLLEEGRLRAREEAVQVLECRVEELLEEAGSKEQECQALKAQNESTRLAMRDHVREVEAQLSQRVGECVASVEGYEEVHEEGRSYVMFSVLVSMGAFSYRLEHRFSEFAALHEKICRRYLPPADEPLPEFPASTFFKDNSASFLEKRTSCLDKWLAGVLQFEVIKGDKDMCHFLELNSVLQLLASMKSSAARLDTLGPKPTHNSIL